MKRTVKGHLNHICYRLLPEQLYLKLFYYLKVGIWPSLTNPKTFREKILWLKRYYKHNYTNVIQNCYDKYLVRDYVKNKIGSKYLIPLVCVSDNMENINYDMLPQSFIIKVSQSCGMNYIVFDKEKEEWGNIKNKVTSWISESKQMPKNTEMESYFYNGAPYIIVEELLQTSDGKIPDDLKVYCLNGKVKFIRVAHDPIDWNGERKKKFVYNTYDKYWNYVEYNTGKFHCSNSNIKIPKPDNLEEICYVAEKLSENFPFARIDLYNVNNKIYFGEITWFPGSVFEDMEPKEWDTVLGGELSLPIEKECT